MDTDSSSIAASRDGPALRQGESVYDEYDEISNVTVGPCSPLAQPVMKSPRSDTKSRISLDPMTPSYENSAVRTHTDPPRQLALNNHNLNGFARSVETGGVPLRLDVMPDDAFVDYATATPQPSQAAKQTAQREDISVVTAAGRTHDAGDGGSDGAESTTQDSNASLRCGEAASVDGNPWNIERASVDPQVGSPTRRHTDPLNSANLDQHLHNLARGPAPLMVENIIATGVPRRQGQRDASMTTVLPETTVASLMVEPSEVDALSISEFVASTAVRPAKPSSVGDAMDDMWSTTSTRGVDPVHLGPGGSADEKLHALSKENLRQLRHQLESGETPLRPELLAGLGTMVRAMTQTNSNKSASTAVEPAMTEERSKVVDSAARLGSPLQSFTEGRGASMLASPNLAKDGEASTMMAGMSFHSTFVEVPATEVGDARALDSAEFPTPEFLHTHRAPDSDRHVDEEAAVDERDEVDEDAEEDALPEKSSTGDDSRDGQNESVFNMTEDDGVDDMADAAGMARHMRELFKLVQEGRQDQTHLRQLVLEQRGVIERLTSTVKDLESKLKALKKP